MKANSMNLLNNEKIGREKYNIISFIKDSFRLIKKTKFK